MHTANVSKSAPVQVPDAVDDCSFTFVHTGGVWYCQVTSAQGMAQYPVVSNVTGAEATALAAVASIFLGLYAADVTAGRL